MKRIAALFKNEGEADAAIAALQEAGFNQERFGLITRNRVLEKVDWAEDVEEGLVQQAEGKLGASGGAAVGGLTGLLLGVGAVVVPGIGPALAAGGLITALGAVAATTGFGAVSGGLLGALTSMGIDSKEVDSYAEGIKRGGILVVVEVEDDSAAFVADVLRQAGALDLSSRRKDWEGAGWSGFDATLEPDETYPNLKL